MSDPHDAVVIARFPDELSALLLVADLEAEGIPARMLGGLTAQLRVEAPGLVSVLVRRGDLVRAERLIAERALPDDWTEEGDAANLPDGPEGSPGPGADGLRG